MDLEPSWFAKGVDPNVKHPKEQAYRILNYYRRKWGAWTPLVFTTIQDAHEWINQQLLDDAEFMAEHPGCGYMPDQKIRIIKVTTEVIEDIDYKVPEQ